MELADGAALFGSPRHPYTASLLAASPVPEPARPARLAAASSSTAAPRAARRRAARSGCAARRPRARALRRGAPPLADAGTTGSPATTRARAGAAGLRRGGRGVSAGFVLRQASVLDASGRFEGPLDVRVRDGAWRPSARPPCSRGRVLRPRRHVPDARRRRLPRPPEHVVRDPLAALACRSPPGPSRRPKGCAGRCTAG